MNITCPRCNAFLLQNFTTEPPVCITCGWEDYHHPLTQYSRKRSNIRDGVVNTIMYIGFANHMHGMTIQVRIEHSKYGMDGLKIIVSCPWDNKDMEAVPKNKSGKARGEQRFKCGREHRVILLSSTNGDWRGWT